jgi:nucleotide-binding universal stress UspA family protein
MLQDILVHIDSSKACEERLNTALALAEWHSAHLTGLYVMPEVFVVADPYIGPNFALIEAMEEAAGSRAAAAEAAFQAIVDRSGFNVEWRCVKDGDFYTFNRSAGYADLAVVGQSDRHDPDSVASAFVEHVVLGSGRPVLVVPHHGSYPAPGERILIAWNGSREAARAISDALPLLEHASHIAMLSINAPAAENGQPGISSREMEVFLRRHGIEIHAETLTASDPEPGNVLLAHAVHQHSDLIVMGAYGHARWREWVLGGTTRFLLQHTTLPVLMSH